MSKSRRLSVLGIVAGLVLIASVGWAQVFPPRQPQPAPQPAPYQGQMPAQPVMPSTGGPPGTLTKSIPFANIIGDPTKSFIQIGNMRSPLDTNFALGRGLTGRI